MRDQVLSLQELHDQICSYADYGKGKEDLPAEWVRCLEEHIELLKELKEENEKLWATAIGVGPLP